MATKDHHRITFEYERDCQHVPTGFESTNREYSVSMASADESLRPVIDQYEKLGRPLSMLTVVNAAERTENARPEWLGGTNILFI